MSKKINVFVFEEINIVKRRSLLGTKYAYSAKKSIFCLEKKFHISKDSLIPFRPATGQVNIFPLHLMILLFSVAEL